MSDQQQQQQQAPGGHYSGANPIPTIQKFIESLDRDKKERDKKIDELKHGEAQGAPKPHTASTGGKPGTRTKVTDPTTGNEVEIENVNLDASQAIENPMLSVPNANLGKPTPVKTDPSQSLPEYREKQDITAPPDPIHPYTTSDVPIHGEKTNILFHPTPSVSYEPTFAALETKASVLCAAVFVAVVLLGKMFGASLKGLIPTAACVAAGIFLWMKEVVRSGRELEWESERKRGETATANLIPESVEWFNTLLGVFWGLIDPEMFASVADTLEDVMQASVPSVIENVRVADIDQGVNPIRILSLRALPDAHVTELKEAIHEEQVKVKDPDQLAAEEEGGDYYNLEVSLAYHAAPTGKSASARARNLHMQLVFSLGVKGLFGVPLPIWVELQSLVATARVRLQMSPEPPFLKNLTFTLMGIPKIEASCTPMMERGVNVLNLPIISNFVNYAIAAASSMYVAPKSMTIDLASILQGDDVQKETEAIGVLWVNINKATGLSKQDKRGSEGGGSDPYITLSFSKYGKPMYCTRVITDDLNPIWGESAALLVTPSLIKADEQLSLELWDSDRHTADDVVGKVELSIQKMIQHPGKMYPQTSHLQGIAADTSMPGELCWEVGYFPKPSFRPALRTDGKNPNLPAQLRDDPQFQDEKGTLNSAESDAVAHTPPDPLWPSGICSVVIHQIVNLELENVKGSQGNRRGREYEPAKDAGEIKDEEGGKLPSAYCLVHICDQLVYRTRSKAVSSRPIYNAGTERFIRDWRSAIVTVTVRDSRQRQHDPILGVVPLKLSELLSTSSQVTRFYPLDGGIGFGRIRLSVLFRSVELRLPPPLLGWDVGTFEFLSERILALNYTSVSKLKLRTGGSTGKIPRSSCKKLAEGDGICWVAKGIKLPVRYRYRSPVVLEFHLSGRRKADAFAIIWLQNLIDNTSTPIDIPIWRTNRPARLCQNYVTEENIKSTPGYEDVTEVGRVQFRAQFKAGMDEEHDRFCATNDDTETYETWLCCKQEGVRGRTVTKDVPESVRKLHERSLVEKRDVLKRASSEERRGWIRDGFDWREAFGDDVARYMSPTQGHDSNDDDNNDDNDDDSSDSDLGIQDFNNSGNGPMNGSANGGPSQSTTNETTKDQKQALHRKHRGLMQWKAARTAAFAKDEMIVGLRKVKGKFTGDLQGREPKVETELG